MTGFQMLAKGDGIPFGHVSIYRTIAYRLKIKSLLYPNLDQKKPISIAGQQPFISAGPQYINSRIFEVESLRSTELRAIRNDH